MTKEHVHGVSKQCFRIGALLMLVLRLLWLLLPCRCGVRPRVHARIVLRHVRRQCMHVCTLLGQADCENQGTIVRLARREPADRSHVHTPRHGKALQVRGVRTAVLVHGKHRVIMVELGGEVCGVCRMHGAQRDIKVSGVLGDAVLAGRRRRHLAMVAMFRLVDLIAVMLITVMVSVVVIGLVELSAKEVRVEAEGQGWQPRGERGAKGSAEVVGGKGRGGR